MNKHFCLDILIDRAVDKKKMTTSCEIGIGSS